MITLRFDQAARMTGGTLVTSDKGKTMFSGVSIDSRSVKQGELFVAIRGERTDGHLYVEQAITRGAAGVMVEKPFDSSQAAVIRVEDCHAAMIELATQYRSTSAAKFVGITGSNGKTTTKEMTYALLSAVESNIYRSAGNLNNLFGLPLSLFAMPQATRIAVMEMGISTPGEMTRLSAIVHPDLAVVTSVAATHLEFLGSVEGVAKAKLELVTSGSREIPVIVNADDKVLLSETKRSAKHFTTFGIDHPASYHPDNITTDESGNSDVTIEGHTFHLPLFGRHQVYNLLAAYAVVRQLGYNLDRVNTQAIALTTAPLRGQRVTHRGVNFIVDCYNANPESMKLGLASFDAIKHAGRRVLILGDMLELGEKAEHYHRELGRSLAAHSADLILLVGPLTNLALEAAVTAGVSATKLRHFDNAVECGSEISNLLRDSDLVFLKGSRGIGLEQVLNKFTGEKGLS